MSGLGRKEGVAAPPDVPNHTLHRCIGRGTYGEVWLATDAMQKWRAVKVVHRREASNPDRGYEREFKALQRYEELSRAHGSLMPILSVGRHPADQFFYYSMELADDAQSGGRLDDGNGEPDQAKALSEAYEPRTLRSELRRRGRLPPPECLNYASALVTAIEQLHTNGLIHRDIKPDNIIFVHGAPKLADVGLVAHVDATYSLAGTTAYLSPEPTRREPADIYALGKVLFEMATGCDVEHFPGLPPEFATLPEVEKAAINQLSAVFCKASDPDPALRHLSARELREELELLKENKSVLRLRELEERDRRWRARVKRYGTLMGTTLIICLATFLMWIYKDRQALRHSLLHQARLERQTQRTAGWFDKNWAALLRSASIANDDETREQAAAALAGIDARVKTNFAHLTAGSAAFSSDGRLVLGGIENVHATLLYSNGTRIESLVSGEGPVGWVNGVPIQLLALSNVCRLVEVHSGNLLREFSLGRGEYVFGEATPAMAMTPDGALVAAAVAGAAERIVTWDSKTGTPIAQVPGRATALTFSPDKSLLAAGGEDGSIRLYSAHGLKPIGVLPAARRPNPILCLAIAPDPVAHPEATNESRLGWLAAGDSGGEIVLWDLTTHLPLAYCRGSPWNVQALAFSPDRLLLASAGRNEQRLWNTMNGHMVLRLNLGDTSDSRALAFSSDGLHLVCGTTGLQTGRPDVVLWELEMHRGIRALQGLDAPVRRTWFSPRSDAVAALADDWLLGVWESRSGRVRALLETPHGVSADDAGGAFDATSQKFAFATTTNVRLYDLNTKQVIARWTLPEGRAGQLQFDTNGTLLLLRVEKDGRDRLATWCVYRLDSDTAPVVIGKQTDTNFWTIRTAFPVGGRRIVIGDWAPQGTRRRIRAVDFESGATLWGETTDWTNGDVRVFLDPTGTVFGYATNGHAPLRLLNLSNFKAVGEAPESCRAVGPAGRVVIGEHQSWKVLDSMGKKPTQSIGLDFDVSSDPCFSPDGKLLTFPTLEGVVLLADLEEITKRLRELGSKQGRGGY